MKPTLFSISVALIASFHIVAAHRSQYPRLAPRQVDCYSNNSESLYDPSCWATLNLTNFLDNWHAPNICSDSDNGVNCCEANEPWSTCFLRLGKGDSGFDCTQISINTNDCAYNGALASNLDPSIRAQVRYILRTIFSASSFTGPLDRRV